jgi:hypothetical protein
MWTQEGGKKASHCLSSPRHAWIWSGKYIIFVSCVVTILHPARPDVPVEWVASSLASYPERPGFRSQSRYRLSHCRVISSSASYSGSPWFKSRSSYTDLNLTWVSSFPPDKCWYIGLNYATTASIHILSNSLFTVIIPDYREFLIFVDWFTATGAAPAARSIRILPMNKYACWAIMFGMK